VASGCMSLNVQQLYCQVEPVETGFELK